MLKQVSLPKISSILQKMKIGQNSIYALFAQSPSIIRFAFCDFQNNQGLGKGYQPQPSASADTLTSSKANLSHACTLTCICFEI